MSRPTRTPANRRSTAAWADSPQREAAIREAAYSLYAQRGYTPGHELDDWLEAEAELERMASESTDSALESGAQQSSVHGAGKDDALKRIVRQHPQKGIPQVDSLDPENAPFRE